MLITLTVNPAHMNNPAERRGELSRWWKHFVKWWKRRNPKKEIAYAVVTEATLNGEPHFHILLRCQWINFDDLRSYFGDHMYAPRVRVERIRTRSKMYGYACKYAGKAAERFNNFKRYYCSYNYAKSWRNKSEQPEGPRETWHVVRQRLSAIYKMWNDEGWLVELSARGGIFRERRWRD